jgi:excisionase family DNA binding protein
MATSALTTAQAAQQLGIGESRVLKLIAAGLLPARKFGKAWMIAPRSLEKARRRPDHRGRPRKGKI